MKYISVVQFADKYGISERTVRHYCAEGKIEEAFNMKRKIYNKLLEWKQKLVFSTLHPLSPMLQILYLHVALCSA